MGEDAVNTGNRGGFRADESEIAPLYTPVAHAPHDRDPLPARQIRRQTHLAARPAARPHRAVRRRAAGDARGGGASGLRADRHHQRDRAQPSPHPLFAHSWIPARAPPPGADHRQIRVRVLDACVVVHSNRRHAVLRRRHEAALAAPQRLVHVGDAGGFAQGAPPHQDPGRADDPGHRRRRAGGQGPRLGEPQAVEARAAAGVLPRPPHRQRAQRDAQDLRADDPAFRLGAVAEGRVGKRDPQPSARPRAALAGRREPGFGLLPRCPAQAGRAAADREQDAPQGAGAGRARGRRQAAALAAAGDARCRRRGRRKTSCISCRRSTR